MKSITQINSIKNIIKGCIKEDRRSQKELYRVFYAFSIAICTRYANNREDAASIMNEGFYKIFTQIKKFDISKPMEPWIRKIMTNTAIDFYRHNLKFAYTSDISDYEHLGDRYEQIYAKLHYDDLILMIHALSPSYRAVFNLYVIEGYNHDEIAQMLNVSIGTSKSNLFKARTKLAEMVKLAELGTNEKKMNVEE